MSGFGFKHELRPALVPQLSPMQIYPAVGVEVAPDRAEQREVPEALLEAVTQLIEGEDREHPMSDNELAEAATERDERLAGGVPRADIALARRQLGLGPADERLEQYRQSK